jgi:hypothetical protein
MSNWGITLILFICLIANSCDEKPKEQPFSDDKMIRLIADMYIIEATMSGKAPDKADSLKEVYRKVVMKDYQIDSNDLKLMEKYLESHPEKSKDIHDKARDHIDHLQKSVN